MDEYEVRKLTDGIKKGQSGLNVLPAVPFLYVIKITYYSSCLIPVPSLREPLMKDQTD